MAQLVPRRRSSNLVMLVTVRKGNPLIECSISKNGPKNALCRRDRNFLKGPHQEEEIQCIALIRSKKLFSNKHSAYSRKATFVIFEKLHKLLCYTEKIDSMEERNDTSINKLIEKSMVPNRFKCFGKVDSSKVV